MLAEKIAEAKAEIKRLARRKGLDPNKIPPEKLEQLALELLDKSNRRR